MRLGFLDLPAQLEKNLAPVYVITGDEPLQHGEAADLVRAAARRQGFTERKRLEVSSGFDWQELSAEASNLSLFAEQRVIDLRIPSGKPGTDGSKAINAWCENPPADLLLLVNLPKLDSSQQKSKWYKALDRSGVVIQVWPVNEQRLPAWIAQRLRQRGMTPGQEVVQMLAERVEGNLLAAAQEIEKLLLLFGPGDITSEQLASSVADSARFDVFTLVDAALAGKAKRCLRILEGLRLEGTPPAVILWALSREIRQLCQLSQALQRGIPVGKILAELRIWDKRKPLVQQGMKRLPTRGWQALLRQCQQADMAIKGQSAQDCWLMLEDISLQMSGQHALPADRLTRPA